jgi:2',3'-cyclic-nucleotide 2'-phosphodiesterase/3'-nucleotidase
MSVLSLSRRSFLASGTAAGAFILLHPFSANAQANQAHLRIMETTDIHVNVLPYDYYADKPNDTMGLARTASLIDAVRKEATNAMLVDNGDLLQGNPMGDYIAYERGMKEGDRHPVIKGMNVLGYAASTLGNHEFNYGLSFMDKVLAGAQFPFVCANLIRGTELAANPRDDKLYLRPYVILDKSLKDGAGAEHPIKIGVIGFVPPQIMIWDSKNLDRQCDGARHRRGGQSLGAADQGRGRRHRHCAVAFRHRHRNGRHDGKRLIPRRRRRGHRRGLTGHQHLVFPGKKDFQGLAGVDTEKGTLQGKPAVQAGFWGSHMGLIDLLLERDGSKVAHRFGDVRGPPDLRARRQQEQGGRRRCRRPSPTPSRKTTRRRSPMSAARSARRPRRSIPISRWSPTTRRCRSSARRRPGTSRTC